MQQTILNYTFNASARTVTFTDINPIDLRRLSGIYNITAGRWIFKFNDPNFGATADTNVLTFTAPNTGMANSDLLLIRYDVDLSTDVQRAQITNFPADLASQTTLATLLTDAQLRATPVNVNLPAGTEVAGPAAQSAINVDLLTGNVNGWYDARAFQSGTIQIVAGAGISAGQIIFEQTNDASSTVGIPLMATEVNVQNANPQVAAFAIAASANRMFRVAVNGGYVRVRIAVAFVGGNVRAFGLFSDFPYSSPIVNVQQATGANLNMQVSNTPAVTLTSTRITPNAADGHSATHHLISAAGTNATLVRASGGPLGVIVLSNTGATARFFKLYNLATAPVVGTSVPVLTVLVPPGQPVVIGGNSPIRLSTGISYAITGGMPVADTTVIGANEVAVSMFFT